MPQDYFRALRDVALAINASLDPKDVLHKISEHTAQTMNCKACTIRLLDSTGHFLLPSAAYGLSATYMRKGPVEVSKSGLDGEVRKGKLIHLRDACSDGRFQIPESAKAEGLGLGLAIVRGILERYAGRLLFSRREGGGLIASVQLPLAAAAPEEPARNQEKS